MFLCLFIITLWNVWLFIIQSKAKSNKPESLRQHNKLPSCLIVVPAHNEELGIEHTLKSLQKNLSKLQSKIIVIADNCDDQTAKQCSRHDIDVVIRNDSKLKGKSHALNWFIKTYSETILKYDTLCIIDADSTLSHNYFRISLEYFSRFSYKIMQTFYTSQKSKAYSISKHALECAHHVRQLGLFNTTGTALLKGNGMFFNTKLIISNGWKAHSITEDLEMSYNMIHQNHDILYCPAASVYGDFAQSGNTKEVQQRRWEGGRWLVLKHTMPSLIKNAISHKSLKQFLLAIDLSVPPMSVLLLLNFVFLTIGLLTTNIFSTLTSILNFGLFLCYLRYLPRNDFSKPGFSQIKTIITHLICKLSIYYSLINKGIPVQFQRTPRLK